MTLRTLIGFVGLAATFTLPGAVQAQPAAIGRVTADVQFFSHDGYPMRGRLTLPDKPGRYPVMVLVQTAEAAHFEPRTRNPSGELVPFYDLYRDHLTPLGVGFFSYEGRGVSTQPAGRTIDRTIYDTSTLENKTLDAIAAVRVLQRLSGVNPQQIYLRGISEGTLLAAAAAARIPDEVAGLVLSGVVTTLKESLRFMSSQGVYLQYLGHWDADRDGRVSAAEFEADPKGIRKQMPPQIEFSVFDLNDDGFHTADERTKLSAPLVAAVEQENMEILEGWLKGAAVVPVPRTFPDWLQEHFRHPSMWDLVSSLTMPIGFFQGDIDANTPASLIRALQKQAEAAGKSNMEFFYFADLDHGLGSMMYFQKNTLSPGYAAIFDFMRRRAAVR